MSSTRQTATWTAEEVASATGGTWIEPPQRGWLATGLCIYAPTLMSRQLAVIRGSGEASKGMSLRTFLSRQDDVAGAIAEQVPTASLDVPLLKVENSGDAVLALGRHARKNMSAKVCAVTGSAGKTTTVAMLSHVLSVYGDVAGTVHGANLPHGVAWNLASTPRDVAHVVLELAVGRMGVSSRLAQPHVSIVTNILPAHLGADSTLRDIALTKSAIFCGMPSGGVAVLNRDMAEWNTVYKTAIRYKQCVLHFGTSPESDYRLYDYDAEEQVAEARLNGKKIRYRIGAPGKHMALNSLAVLAAVSALGLPLQSAVEALEDFSPLPGRGQELPLVLDGRTFTLIDDAYNANPGSMTAALENLISRSTPGRKIAVVGEMAELGPSSAQYHARMLDALQHSELNEFICLGKTYGDLWRHRGSKRRGILVASLEELHAKLTELVDDGDTVLVKGSHSTDLHRLVGVLKREHMLGQPAPAHMGD